MNLPNLRNRQVFVSSSVYNGLRAIADLEHAGCLDEIADAWLAEKLASDPRDARRRKLIAEAMKDVERKLEDEFSDKLP